MKTRAGIILLLCSISFLSAFAQNQLFDEAFKEFATSRFWEFEEIRVDWKMEGKLQADFNEGLNNLLEDNPKMAEVSLTSVIEKDSTLWQAFYYRAAARKKLEKFKGAERDIQHALRLHHDFYEGLVELAKIYYFRGKIVESERTFARAIRLDGSRGVAYYLKGDIDLAQGESRKAMGKYKDCLAADSLFHSARIKLALLEAMLKKNVSTALVNLNTVLASDSLQKDALLFRSIIGHEKNKRQAVDDLSTLLRVSPDNMMALYYRGLFSTQLEDYERAFVDFHKVIKITAVSDNKFSGKQTWLDKKIDLQNAGAYTVTRVYGLQEEDGFKIRQAYCHILIGEYDKSLAAIDRVSNATNEPVAVYLKAVAYEHKGEHIKAFQYYDIAVSRDAKNAEAYKKRGIYRQETKDWLKSADDFTVFLKTFPNDYFVNYTRGVSYYYMGRFQEALTDFNIYLKNDSTNKEVIGARGMVYMNTNQRLKGYVDLTVSGNIQALNFYTMEHLIDSVLHLNDTTQALYCLDIMTKEAPYFTEGYVQKLKIHMARGEWKTVTENISRALRNSRTDTAKSKHSYLLTIMGMMHSKNRHTTDAMQTLSEAIKFDEKNDFAYLERARVFMALGKLPNAEKDLRVASALGNQEAKKMLAGMTK